MAGKRRTQYSRGEASNFLSRKSAMKKLQLSLKDFRRLCILKGIHPREPRNRKRAQKGDMTKVATLFHEKDIRFLLHEPIVNRFRDFKVFLRKLKKATDKGDKPTVERLEANRPRYTLDHVVKERYPTFIDAIRDLEDCLCLCFLYATFPKTARTPSEMTELCGRLTTEFMHVVMESRALRKVFVSIKGYYYQAEILGQTVTWVVPHSFMQRRPDSVDMRLMSIFVEFYTTMLGFVNFRLYHNLNLKYPPTLEGYDISNPSDKAAALNQSLNRTVVMPDNDEVKLDEIVDASSDEKLALVREQQEERRKLQSLFEGLKFYLGREVPQTPLIFIIRSCGGQVSWADDPQKLFDEDDPSITHQIVDRSNVDQKHLNRCYLQPQWVFDSINKRQRLNERNYLAGKELPPHLSPFVEERRVGEYAPPEETNPEEMNEAEDEDNVEENEDEQEEEVESGEDDDMHDDEEDEEEDKVEEEDDQSSPLSRMRVDVGRVETVDPSAEKAALEAEELKLRKMMIKKKHRGLYRSMMKSRNRRVQEAKVLQRKRKAHDDLAKSAKKVNKSK